MILVAKEGPTHLEDVSDSGLCAEDQPRIGLNVGVFSCFWLGCMLPVYCTVAITSKPREEE